MKRPGSRAAWLEALLPLALILVTWLGIAWHLADEAARVRLGAEQKSRAYALAYAEDVKLSIDAIDQAMIFLRATYQRDPAHFNIMQDNRAEYFLHDLASNVSIFDRDGTVVASTLSRTGPAVNIADLEQFQVHKTRNSDELFISKLTFGRVSKQWNLRFTRRLSAPDGSFAGVIDVVLAPERLTALYKSIDIGSTGTLAVLGLDGTYRARASASPLLPGRSIEQVTPTADRLRVVALQQDETTVEVLNPLDNVRRIVSLRRVPELPLLAAVGLGVDEVMTLYRRDRAVALAVGAGLTLAFALAGFEAARRRRSLTQAENALHAAIENISQGILMVDAEKRVPVINRRAIELLGLPDHLVGSAITWDGILQWQLAHDFAPGAGFLETDPAALGRAGGLLKSWPKYERRRPNGRLLEIQTTHLPDGGAVRTYTDITERRADEDALMAARDSADAASRNREMFLARMSHELRTPMNGVLGMTSLLLDTALDTEQTRLARTVHASAGSLLSLIDDILTFTQLAADEITLETSPVSLRSLLSEVIALMAPAAETKKIALSWTIADTVPVTVLSDSGRLRQVLVNLIDNAIKFTERGLVSVAVNAVPGKADESQVDWAISDTGIGIAPAAQAELFQEFWQADLGKSRRFGGVGLGLAICRGLIELMGGRISVESQIGRGSIFRYVLPLRHAAPETTEVIDGNRGIAAQRPLRVLLAEDNRTNQFVADRLLQKLGHQVDTVVNGRAAVAAVHERRYDLVLMDMMMPELDGIAATHAIRGLPDPAAARTPILAFTANALPRDRDMCLEAGMNGYLSKPMRLDELAAAIAEALATALPGQPASPRPPDAPAFHPATLAQLARDIGPADASAVLDAFLEDAVQRLAQVAQAAEAMDAATISREAHTLKSAAASVGFLQLAVLGEAVQRSAGRMDMAGLQAASTRLSQQFSAGCAALAAWRDPGRNQSSMCVNQ